MNIPYVMRKCGKCGRWLVASTDNFYKNKKGKYNLRAECKECTSEQQKQYRKANKEKMTEYNKRYRKANREKLLEQQKQWYQDNKDKIAEYNKQWYEANKDKIAEQHKQYYETNKEKITEYGKRYREANKDKERERSKRYYEANKDKQAKYYKQYNEINKDKVNERNKRYNKANKDKIAEYHKQWCQSPQGQISTFNINQRRRIKEEQQGTGITKDQWLECMSFFDWKCAYSGETLTNNTRSVDHIVPLNSGGDNAIWNCVPMTRSLNSSKNTKDMLEWYREQSFYSEARLEKIYKWQEYAYNKYGKNTEYFNSGDIQIKLI